MSKLELHDFQQRISEYRQTSNWKTRLGELPEAKDPDYDDSGWETCNPGTSWDRSVGERWIRRTITVPEKLFGIDLTGGKIDFRIMALAEIQLFLDGKYLDGASYWFDGLYNLTSRANPGEKHVIALCIPQGSTSGRFNAARLYVQPIEDALLQLRLVDARSRLIHSLADRGHLDSQLPGVNIARRGLFLEEGLQEDLERALTQAHEFDQEIVPAAKPLEELTTFLVGHAHIDMNWLWDFEDTIDICRRTFLSVDHLMDEFPEFVFSQSQGAIYSLMQDHEPEVFERIKRRVKEGRWDVTASTWVEGDLNMASGESLVRQTTHALRYLKREFDVQPKICWCPDTFGHCWTYPQILSKCGVEYYYAHRCTREPGEHMFQWEAPDGSRVLVFNEGATYNNQIKPDLVSSLPKMVSNFSVPAHLVVFGVGDHGGGPTRMDLRKASILDSEPGFPSFRNSQAQDFYIAAQASEKLPVIRDELNFVFRGCYTTHADIKLMNRRGESMLFAAEVLSSLASISGQEYPRSQLETAWENVLFNQFHDLLDGSAIKEAYEHSERIFEEAESICRDIEERSLRTLTGSPGKVGNEICIFNPLGWRRREVISAPLPAGENDYVVIDPQERIQASQRVGDEVLFTADLPSVGYSTYTITTGTRVGPVQERQIKVVPPGEGRDSHSLENRFFKVEIEANSGTIKSLFDKRLERELISIPESANMFQLCYEKPHGMSAWRIGPISKVENLTGDARTEVSLSGPVKATVTVDMEFSKSTLRQEISIYRDIPRIDFRTEVDWQEIGGPEVDSPMLKVAFPWAHVSANCIREIPFGHISSPADGQEVPSLTFLELPGDGFGISVLNDGKYGHDVKGNTVRLTLLRAAYDPDPEPDLGSHHFTYSIVPHAGDWKSSEVWKRGHELNTPCRIIPATPPRPRNSWLSLGSKGVDVAAIKRAEDDLGLVVRLVEMQGKETRTSLRVGWPVEQAQKCDLMEREISDPLEVQSGEVEIELSPYEISTWRLT